MWWLRCCLLLVLGCGPHRYFDFKPAPTGVGGGTAPATGSTSSGTNLIDYRASALGEVASWYRAQEPLELASQLLDLVHHPQASLVAEDCGVANAFYSPARREIRMCHELVAHVVQTFGQGTRARRVVNFVVEHEVGHALIDMLELPIVGREEDAADQLAALWILAVPDRASRLEMAPAVLDAARYFRESTKHSPVWNEHSLGDVRYFDLLCLVHGAVPELRAEIERELPAARAERCEAEYQRVKRGWDTLLAPHSRD